MSAPNHETVCVFCASSTKVSECYIKSASDLAEVLVREGYAIRYGGGEVGLMGALANSCLKSGGKITGIIPRFMVEVEWQHKDVEDMVLVETMHERKKLLVEDVAAVIALPGSTGTLEELMEVISMKKLGLFIKPIIILNINGFYDPMLAMFKKMVMEEFMRPEHLKAFSVVSDVKDIVQAIRQEPDWYDNAIAFATL